MIWLELVLLLAALGAVVWLSVDLGGGWLRDRRQREHLERLEAGEAAAPEERPPGRIDSRLLAAGLAPAASVYLVAAMFIALIVFLGTLEAFPGNLLAAALAAILAVWLPWSLLGSWGRRRGRRFETHLVDAVAFMITALRAGENPAGALGGAALAAEGSVAGELRRVVGRLDAGTEIHEALAPMMAGYDSEGCRLFAQTLIAKWHAGGDLAPVLERVNRIMRERLAMRLRLRSELAGARLAAVIVTVMPYLLLPVLWSRRPEWFRSLFENPLGLQLLFVAILLQLVGILWLRRIMRTELV